MKTTAFLAALAAFLLADPSASFAQSSGAFSFGAPKAANPADFVTVEAKGQGESVEAAKADAARNAIKKAVGELVDAKTLVENDELVEDKILTLSNAVIEKADYGEAKRSADGLFEVSVQAVVKKGRLNQELKAAGIATGAVKGDSLAAELFSGKERVANAKKFFAERLKGFPGNVVEAVMLTKDDGNGNQVPDIGVDSSSGHVFANVGVQVNMENYAKFTQALCELLDAVCLVKEDVIIPFQESRFGGDIYYGSSQKKGLDSDHVLYSKRPEENNWLGNNVEKSAPVIVAHPSAKGLKRTSWPATIYYVDPQIFLAFVEELYTQVGCPLSGSAHIVLKDSDGSPICSEKTEKGYANVNVYYTSFAPYCNNLPQEHRLKEGHREVHPCNYVFITPVLKNRFSAAPQQFSYSRELDPMLRFRIDLGAVSEDDLADVAGYEVKVVFE